MARADDVAAKTDELQKLAAKHRLRAIGPVSLAQYDPPWTLWFMRRNEVSIPVSR
ncbi:MAG: heme-binding protein [Sphingomonas sp.]